MTWECLNCGLNNEPLIDSCARCQMDREKAQTMTVSKRKRMCDACGHRHREGFYCHVYVEGADDDAADDYISESASESSESSDSDESLDIKAKLIKEEKHNKVPKPRPMTTPLFVKRIGFLRCNCKAGVPMESKRFEPLPRIVLVDKIQIQTYNEVMIPSDKTRFNVYLKAKYPESLAPRRQEERRMNIAANVPHILSYLPLALCSPVPQVSRAWNWGTGLYTEYIDMRNCVPWQVFRPHIGQVDSVLIKGTKVYSGGDKRVMASDLSSGEVLSTITRDSGCIPYLFEKEDELFMSSSNGSIRTYVLTHTGKNIKMNKTLWEHSRSVNQLMLGLPSNGICEMHGIENHICTMFTASDDRTIKMWNMASLTAIRNVSSKALRTATFMRLAQSDRHIYAGTSNATVAVFSKNNICERDDVHTCFIPNSDQSYCLQITLKLPPQSVMSSGAPASVTGLLCVEFDGVFVHLWAGDTSGQLTIWHVPEHGLEFVPAHTIKAHYGPINNIVRTFKHAITISDDGFIVLFELARFFQIRSIDIRHWAVERQLMQRPDIHRRIKSAHVEENFESGGTLVLGTSYGEVVALSLGTTV